MGYINLVAYVQCEINNILQSVRTYVRAYVNDIISGAKSLSNLFNKMCIFFDIFFKYNISIQPTKSFLNYLDIRLLNQQVNFLGQITSEEKLRAIKHLIYPKTLYALKYYLGLTGYLRNYIHYYAQLADLLQMVKTTMLKSACLLSQQQRAYTLKIKLPLPSLAKLIAF